MRLNLLLRNFVLILLLCPAVTLPGAGAAFPDKPIRLVTAGTGGSADFIARLIAQGLSINLGQQVIVDNRGNGVIPAMIVSKAQPDGYTLLVSGSLLWIGPLLDATTPYDAVKDFTPITLATTSPNVLVVTPLLPANSVRELVALARAKPGALNYSSGATGASSHLAGELFKVLAGVDIVRIPYKSNSLQMADLIGGQIQIMFSNATAPPPHLKSGRLRALAVTTAKRSRLYPDLPTMAEAGVAGYEAVAANGVLGPPKLPAALVNRLSQEILKILSHPEYREKFLNAGVEPSGGPPSDLAVRIKEDIAMWGDLIRKAGIRGE